ncbi:uncharacterized protein LOC114289482 isoform X3 [Camellia sinensis]|uniref:uncharacterized protein LOC114289482 isoform X3 n=1 Tax=Camellia sinensis TaxID=4442 RepID=UPI001036A8E0|nr:uncharacterized protein LOC114289482 isoform X3 [Camellia sinensis]
MPGTIHVSVMAHKDLQSSSPTSSILIKVSMGKREYQTWDEGVFSFPLTTLRDNLSITLEDTEGNEISHRVVQSMSVVEKGSWDEFLPLEGGGHVHMKLQFVLSEEERSRIRIMRESAMKKKNGDLLKSLETASTAGGIVLSSLRINHEVSDSQRSVTHNEATSIGNLAAEYAIGNEEEIAIHQKQITPNDADGSEETSSAALMSKMINKFVEKTETKLRHVDVPKTPVFFQENSSDTKKNLVASELKNDQADQLEKPDLLERTPINVREMISAFESSLAKQDTRPGIKPPLTKPQSSKVGSESPEDLNLKEMTKQSKLTSGRLKNPFLTRELQQIQTYELKRKEHIGFDQDSTVQIQFKETESIAKHEPRKPQEDLVRMSAVEAATILGTMREEHSEFHQPRNLLVNQEDSDGTSNNSNEINIQGPSEDKLKSTFCENLHSFYVSSGAWVFPDHTRRLCITTGSKQLMDLVGGCGIEEWTHKVKKSISLPENVEEFGNYTEVNKGNKTSHEPRKSRLESSAEVETSTGAVGQAMKIAIMVAFGTLVLVTRQRKPSWN